ncbi:MAG: hypothetical protein R3A13_12665 [Bdellovibrionota bacterium]
MKHLGTDYQELATIIHDAEYPSIKGKGISLADLKTMPDRLPKRDGLEPHVEVIDEDTYADVKNSKIFSHIL